jgi:tricorn protease
MNAATKQMCLYVLTVLCSIFTGSNQTHAQGFEGYYRYPDVHENTVIFAAEGDLWTVPLSGGLAQRLTTHQEDESFPRFSPDGKTVLYSASYEGPTEIYTIPVTGGLPTRWTYESDHSIATTWTPDGKIVYSTKAYSTLPDMQLVKIDTLTRQKERVPLSQADEASFNKDGTTVYFVRPWFHGNVTKRYKGGTARQIWKYSHGSPEAIKLTTGYAGESHHPMWHDNRIYFITDRDGIMNIWSMNEEGGDLKQHTHHTEFDVRYAENHQGTIVYQLGADIWHYNVETNTTKKIDIRLATDLDQLRERWVENPSKYITSVKSDPEGNRIVITARGRVFVVPVKTGRLIEFTDKKDVRYRDAVFSSDGESIIVLSDESGEFEFIRMPSNGIGSHKSLTGDGKVLRFSGLPSPDGLWLAYTDLDQNLFILDIGSGRSNKISTNQEGLGTFRWSPDSKWIAFVQSADNMMQQIHLYSLNSGETFPITTDRANSRYPQWSPDGKFIYFLSDRSFTTLVGSPWGSRQPEPYFDAKEKLYHIALEKGQRSPFRPADELFSDREEQNKTKGNDDKHVNENVQLVIDKEGITERITEVPIEAGNYRKLGVTEKAIFLMKRETGIKAKTHLAAVKISNDTAKMTTIVEDVTDFELAENGKKILVRKKNDYYMIPADTGKVGKLNENKIDLKGWRFSISPREDWQQIFTDAWRMERDYFYDKNMHGVNWKAMYNKYYPLTNRVTTRNELSDLIGRFVGELAALHTSVHGGDVRDDKQNIQVACLGARFSRDEEQGGFRIEYIYKADPDYPDERSPLDDPYQDIIVGDVITSVNGRPALSALDMGELIRNQAGKQVYLRVKRNAVEREFIVTPTGNSRDLRYRDWEYSRRIQVEQRTDSKVGYVHLQAMGAKDINQWYREFYPVFDRPGLIIDVRHNRGGNIESFILEKLLRKDWMYWKSRTGKPTWNMQYAFRGHIVILVDRLTASDGEAFADGFKRLNLGTAIGTRTWGGEIWLSSVNRLSDDGIARAPMSGVYGPEGEWLIEGHGFEPDIVVDNLPYATFKGEDAQLDAAIELLEKLIAEDPREVPQPPAYPDKSFNNKE